MAIYTADMIKKIQTLSNERNPNGSNLTVHQIARRLDVSHKQVSLILRTGQAYVKPKTTKKATHKPTSFDTQKTFVRDFFDGLTAREIAKQHNVSLTTVSYWARNHY